MTRRICVGDFIEATRNGMEYISGGYYNYKIGDKGVVLYSDDGCINIAFVNGNFKQSCDARSFKVIDSIKDKDSLTWGTRRSTGIK